MIQAGVLQRQQPLLSRAAGDEQGTDGEVGSTGEPLASAGRVIAASFAEWVRHWTGSNSATLYFEIFRLAHAEHAELPLLANRFVSPDASHPTNCPPTCDHVDVVLLHLTFSREAGTSDGGKCTSW